ncbi:hypothetical protein CSA56_14630 [candidate division KSB3 bacterium]|uniref:GGDEF domain-containing protein n=1 Tax=candidate division KSB3 bacterium TaxID=2044937 RepID=A0A2G6KAF3_9BACT|nr:MAG: hypothetical protein CSA56_14630 [candidate division KSB3 bacterium]
MLDLDNVKTINDMSGHDIGDELLKIFTDHLFRLSGDEFTILLNDLTEIVTWPKCLKSFGKPLRNRTVLTVINSMWKSVSESACILRTVTTWRA